MLTTRRYIVGGQYFSLRAEEELLNQLPNFRPFESQNTVDSHDETVRTDMFIISAHQDAMPATAAYAHVYTDQSDADMPRIEIYRDGADMLFCLSQMREGAIVCAIRCSDGLSKAEMIYTEGYFRFAIDNATMLLYAFCGAERNMLLMHASVIVKDGFGHLFLGRSGTGKSTHSSLWQHTYPDAELLNDDNPVIRVAPGAKPEVYGSPWSGKTNCYKQQKAPIRAIVQLAQAPYNSIARLRPTHAYPYIMASASGLKIEPEKMDRLYDNMALLIEQQPIYKLDCLPNQEAARLCYETVSGLRNEQ